MALSNYFTDGMVVPMNLPTTATALSPEDWLRVMSLIHPDNVNETLRVLHAHQPMVDALLRCHRLIATLPANSVLEKEVAGLLNQEDAANYEHPWPPEPQLEEPLQPEQA